MNPITEMSLYWFFTGCIMMLPHFVNAILLPKRDHPTGRLLICIPICLAAAFVDPLFPMSFWSVNVIHVICILLLIWCCRLRPVMYCYYFIWGLVLYYVAEQMGAVMAAAVHAYGELPLMYLTKSVSSILVTLVQIWLIQSIRKKGADEFRWNQVALSVLISVLIIFINIMSYHGTPDREVMIFLFQLFSMMIAVLALYLQVIITYSTGKQNETEFMKFLVRANRKDYEMKKEYIDLVNRKYHDIKHEIRALKQMDSESRQKELEKLEKEVDGFHNVFQTGNEVLDTILNDKRRECDKAGIIFTCSSHVTGIDFIDLVDMNILLGNMIDNAIEAVISLSEEQRFIDLKIFIDKQFVRIREMNFFSGELQYSEDRLLSTKPQDGYHGFGTRSMKYIVDRYGGEITVKAEKPVFQLFVMIPIPA